MKKMYKYLMDYFIAKNQERMIKAIRKAQIEYLRSEQLNEEEIKFIQDRTIIEIYN